MPKWFPVVLAIIMALSIPLLICVIAFASLTNREASLLGVLLSIASVVASWIVSHIYAEVSTRDAIDEVKAESQATLRLYALKASEKVNNLSTQLGNLSSFIQVELDYEDYKDSDQALQGRNERMESTIHIINTLKSINDNALSDWRGVIGEELDQKRQQREKLEIQLAELAIKVNSLSNSRFGIGNTSPLDAKMDSLRAETRALLSSLGASVPAKSRNTKHPKLSVSQPCPKCSTPLAYKQRSTPSSVKAVECTSCNAEWVSRFDGSRFALTERLQAEEHSACPNCGRDVVVFLDNLPNNSIRTTCTQCAATVRFVRDPSGIRVECLNVQDAKSETSNSHLGDALLERVKGALPAQPWPDGLHKVIAPDLKISPKVAMRAINELINQGVFKMQVNGKLYTPTESNASAGGSFLSP